MRGYIDHVLALLPFEPAALWKLDGPPSTYVGHPLSEQVGELRPNAEEARRRLADPPVLLVLAGQPQRRDRAHGGCVRAGGGVAERSDRRPRSRSCRRCRGLPTWCAARVKYWNVPARVVTEPAEKNAAFRIARAALTKSGTSTLELALAGVPMVAAYKVSLIEELVARLVVKVPSIILANLVLGENVVPELVQRGATPIELAKALLPLMSDTPERRRQIDAFARLDSIMEIGPAIPSDRAAAVVLECIGHIGPAQRETVAPPPLTA